MHYGYTHAHTRIDTIAFLPADIFNVGHRLRDRLPALCKLSNAFFNTRRPGRFALVRTYYLRPAESSMSSVVLLLNLYTSSFLSSSLLFFALAAFIIIFLQIMQNVSHRYASIVAHFVHDSHSNSKRTQLYPLLFRSLAHKFSPDALASSFPDFQDSSNTILQAQLRPHSNADSPFVRSFVAPQPASHCRYS